jgi:ABC-type branched-subunit amino acid transport system ATPase component/ABC-type branched-subunit amino acid transport system permease subunit
MTASAAPVPMTAHLWPRFLGAAVIVTVVPVICGWSGILNDSRANAIGFGACLALAAFALNVVLGYTGQLSLATYAIVGFGAFVGSRLTSPTDLRLSFIIGLLLAGLAGASAGLLIGLPALRIRGLPLAIATLAFQYAAWQAVFRSRLLSTGSAGVSFVRPWIGHTELKSGSSYLAVVLLVCVAIWLLDTNLTSSKVGRAFQAIRADEDIAQSFGIPVPRYKLGAFALSGFYAAIAGFLLGHLQGFVNNDTFDLNKSLIVIIAVVVGGLGSRPGIAVAAGFFGVSPLILELVMPESIVHKLELLVGATLLLLTMALNPGGIAAGVRHGREERDRKRLLENAGADDHDAAPTVVPALPRPAVAVGRQGHGDIVLEATDIVVDFGGVRAVDGAGLVVPRGKIVGLIGPNGAGKTTFFNAVSGAVKPTSGVVKLLGEDVSHLPAHERARRGLGRTFQQIGLARDRSVTENLLLAQHASAAYDPFTALAGVWRAPTIEAELRQRAAEALEALGFERFADAPVGKMSGGQQRLVELACRLVAAPEIVLLDEPSAGMAPGAVEGLAERLRELRDDHGRTLVLVEHNIPLVLEVCDEVTVLAAGRVLATGKPRDVVEDPAVIEAYLGGGFAGVDVGGGRD